MSAQRARPAVTPSRRSIHPTLPGVPWWAAIVVAVTATAAGFAFDAGSGNKELTHAFSALYVLGCIIAVLVVQQSGVFTAVIQPPLILFCAVPGAYWLFHGAKITGLKDLLINCGYPLIERFPLMLFTSAAVLLLGIIRWYLGMSARRTGAATAEPDTAETPKLGLVAKLASLVGRDPTEPEHTRKSSTTRRRRTEAAGRPTKSAAGRPSKRPAATRTRRPPLDETAEPTRRRRSTRSRDAEGPDAPRRSRTPRDPDLRGRPPREIRRDPHVRRSRATGSRFDPYEPTEGYEPIRPAERRRSPSTGTTTHHPISRVRYRTDDSRKPWEYDD